VQTDTLWQSLERLDAEDRALLELSLRRQIEDDALARLLRTEPDSVESRRRSALERLASETGGDSPAAVEEALLRRWREGRAAEDAEPEAPEPRAPVSGVAVDEAAREHALRRERRPAGRSERPTARGLAILLLIAAAAVGVVLATSGGDDDEPREQGRAAEGRAVTGPVRPLGAAAVPVAARGTARLVRQAGRWRLRIELVGLPPGKGPYALWLYNTVGDARLLSGFAGPRLRLSAPLPEGFERYRLVDVSAEPRDGNPNHSGASLLRVELKRLLPPA
jgi:hypothetical protein